MTVLLTVAPIRSGSPSAGEYDPWLDWNDDGKIDMKDIGRTAKAFGTNGQNVSKASLEYDSGWLDLRNETGETYTITHNLNDTELQVDARGITSGWNKTYGGTSPDELYWVVQTGDGGYALAGYTMSFGAGDRDFWLVKTDANGNMQWNKTYGGTSPDWAFSVVQTGDGGYALAGSTQSFGTGGCDFWLVKTDANGNMQWNKTYGGTGYDYAQSVVKTGDGGYAIAGPTTSFGAGNDDFWLVKTDANGNMQWNKTYGGTGYDYAQSVVKTGDGGYAIAGPTTSFGAGNDDFWLVKTDANGNMQWNKTYGGTGDDWAVSLIQTGDGGYALAGYTSSFGAGWYDFWLVKTNSAGTMQWNKTYGGTNADYGRSVVQTGDGGYALAGYTYSFGAGNADDWLVKTDASGNQLWNTTYGGTSEDGAYWVVQTGDGGYALAGFTYSFGAGNRDAWLVKTESNGNMQWNKTYGGTADDEAWKLIQTGDGGYAPVGWTTSFGAGNRDAWLVKTDASGNIGGDESGLAWIYSSANTVTLYRGATDTSWNYVRVRLWKPR
jgi:hypothetical protein